MKAKIVITAEGKISVITQEGTFDEGKVSIERLLDRLEAEGLQVEGNKEFEQHRHDHEHAHVHIHN